MRSSLLKAFSQSRNMLLSVTACPLRAAERSLEQTSPSQQRLFPCLHPPFNSYCSIHNCCCSSSISGTKRGRNTLPVSEPELSQAPTSFRPHQTDSVTSLSYSVPSVSEPRPSAVSARVEYDSSATSRKTSCNSRQKALSQPEQRTTNSKDSAHQTVAARATTAFQKNTDRATLGVSELVATALPTQSALQDSDCAKQRASVIDSRWKSPFQPSITALKSAATRQKESRGVASIYCTVSPNKPRIPSLRVIQKS